MSKTAQYAMSMPGTKRLQKLLICVYCRTTALLHIMSLLSTTVPSPTTSTGL